MQTALTIINELLNIFDDVKIQNTNNNDDDDQKGTPDPFKNRAPHLRPFFYRVTLTSRPFGLALCKTFEERFLCVVLPESPSGQLGLRAGSELLSINSFADKSEVIKTLNEQFPEKKHQFIWMYNFPKVLYLQDNSVMPITLYLKYDPLLILANNKVKVLNKDNNTKDGDKTTATAEDNCNYWRLLQDDIYRWSVDNKAEMWIVIDDICNIYSIPPIQSSIIQKNISDYYNDKNNKILVQNRLKNKKNNNTDVNDDGLKSLNDFIKEDIYYKKIGEVSKGTKLKVYCKAGAYIEIREPKKGWIKFKTEGNNTDNDQNHCIKCDNQNIINDNDNDNDNDDNNNDNDRNVVKFKEIAKNQGNFTLFIAKDYLMDLTPFIAPINRGLKRPMPDDNDNDNDNANDLKDDDEYDVMNIINHISWKSKYRIIYFMGDIDFGHTFLTQEKHLKQLINLQNKYYTRLSFIIIRVCCFNKDPTSSKMKEKLKLNNKELNGFIYGRSSMEVLKIYNLLRYDTGFFKYGLMFLDKNNKILISPNESIDIDKNDNNNKNTLNVFDRIASYVVTNK